MHKKVSYESFDWDQLDKYLQFKPNLVTTAELMECSQTTIKDYIKRKHNMTLDSLISAYSPKVMLCFRLM